jgi:hypothetical protein
MLLGWLVVVLVLISSGCAFRRKWCSETSLVDGVWCLSGLVDVDVAQVKDAAAVICIVVNDSGVASNERGCKAQPDGEVYCVLREWRRLE